jgi:hypothetical protein
MTGPKPRRPYKVGVRLLGASSNLCFRRRSYSTREAAFAAVAPLLAQYMEGAKNPAEWDATVFGPDPDLITGRIVRPDGTEADLLKSLLDAQRELRESLHASGWTDEDIGRGERAL